MSCRMSNVHNDGQKRAGDEIRIDMHDFIYPKQNYFMGPNNAGNISGRVSIDSGSHTEIENSTLVLALVAADAIFSVMQYNIQYTIYNRIIVNRIITTSVIILLSCGNFNSPPTFVTALLGGGGTFRDAGT